MHHTINHWLANLNRQRRHLSRQKSPQRHLKKHTPHQTPTPPISSPTQPHPITPTSHRQHNPKNAQKKSTKKHSNPLLPEHIPINPKNTHRNHSHHHPQNSLSKSRHNNLQNNRRQKYKTTIPTPHLKQPPTSALSPALATIAFNQPRGFNRNRFQELQIRPKNHPNPPIRPGHPLNPLEKQPEEVDKHP